MRERLSVIYFAGLIMFGIAMGSYTGVAEYAFMIVGGGAVCYATAAYFLRGVGGR